MSCFAGHGMLYEGKQVLLTNEFDPKKGFYKKINVEACVRDLTASHPNLYWIAIFACCRELYDPQKHSGGISFEDALSLGKGKKVKTLMIGGNQVERNDSEEEENKGDGRG